MDKRLLELYMLGFRDELNNDATKKFDTDLENSAYNLGSLHALVGDDCRSVDYLTDEDILALIKK